MSEYNLNSYDRELITDRCLTMRDVIDSLMEAMSKEDHEAVNRLGRYLSVPLAHDIINNLPERRSYDCRNWGG